MTLHLLHLPVDVPGLMACGREHGLVGNTRSVDLGYLVHSLFARALGNKVAQPFDIQPGPGGETGRRMAVLAYAGNTLAALRDRAQCLGDARAFEAIGWDSAGSKPMPTLAPGQRVGFRLRVCPIIRIGKRHPFFAPGAEVDPYLAMVRRGGHADDLPTREAVYRDWLMARVGPAAVVEAAILASLRDARLWRKGQSGEGPAGRMHDRPRPDFNGRRLIGRRDAVFKGTLVVSDPVAFTALLARGVGRHRAFGFGMLLLRPADA